MPLVSVIILNWNGAHLLRRYLPTVVAHTAADVADVVVADNGSTDESLSVLAAEFSTVRVLALGQNYGFAEGYNRAIAQVATPYVVLLNDDVAVTPGWLGPLVEYMERHADVAACQPKLLSDREPGCFEYAGAAGGYLDRYGYPYCRGRIFGTVEADRGQYDTVRPVMWATGACLMVRTELYRLAGGLDARFFAHMEEIDLCWRLRRMGCALVCVPASAVRHLGGASLAVGHPHKTMLNFRNSLLMLWKNTPDARRRTALLRRRKWLDALAALNFLLHGQLRHVAAIRRAHCEAARMLREEYAPEAALHHASPLFTADAAASSADAPSASSTAPITGSASTSRFAEADISILWQYYVRGRRTFAALPLA